ncbi:MAG: hypothetical protein ACE5J0_02950 [Candidatus Paceibacterales bacterium]
MAITFVKKIKKQRYLIYVLVALIATISFTIWKGYIAEEEIIEEEILKPIKKIEINFKLLKSQLLEEFQFVEKISPIEAETEIGRDNPFVPY